MLRSCEVLGFVGRTHYPPSITYAVLPSSSPLTRMAPAGSAIQGKCHVPRWNWSMARLSSATEPWRCKRFDRRLVKEARPMVLIRDFRLIGLCWKEAFDGCQRKECA